MNLAQAYPEVFEGMQISAGEAALLEEVLLTIRAYREHSRSWANASPTDVYVDLWHEMNDLHGPLLNFNADLFATRRGLVQLAALALRGVQDVVDPRIDKAEADGLNDGGLDDRFQSHEDH